jgi:hypothetical protein
MAELDRVVDRVGQVEQSLAVGFHQQCELPRRVSTGIECGDSGDDDFVRLHLAYAVDDCQ